MKDAGAAPETHAVTAPQARNLLKLAALATMTVDHVGAVFFPHAYILRIIGRLAFPFFAYLMARGYENTRSWPRYLGRLLVFGVIAQPLYARLFPGGLNIFFTLALGLLAVAVYDRYNRTGALLLCLSALFVPGLDYSIAGPFTVLAFHLLRRGDKRRGYLLFTASMLLLASAAPLQLFAFTALYFLHRAESSTWDLPLIYPRYKYLFYAYYPLHLAVLAAIKGTAP